MKISAWRIVRRGRSDQAFSGEGARLFGGRWNSPGTPLVYMSDSLALAALETIVNINPRITIDYVCFNVRFDSAALDIPPEVPEDWMSQPASPATQILGDRWAASRRSLVLSVPSALVPTQRTYLLNRRHPGFARLDIGEPITFPRDPRLLKKHSLYETR